MSRDPAPARPRRRRLLRWLLALSALLIASAILPRCASAPPPGSPAHHAPGGFRNLHSGAAQKSLLRFFWMRLTTDWADHEAQRDEVPRRPVDRAALRAPEAGVQATWIGHSTYLLQLGGKNILTDPIFSERASPVSWAGPKRYQPPALSIDELPPIDFVLISHNHYDHLDLESARQIGDRARWLVPLKNAPLLRSVGISRITELDWWGRWEEAGLSFTATPVQHWSARGVSDRFEMLWSGWAIEGAGARLYFAGDTGYNPVDFKETGRRLGPFDLALIPIGAYAPRDFMRMMHINPAEAVQIHRELRSRRSLAIHWGTFPLTAEAPGDPPAALRAALSAAGLPEEAFQAPPLGTTTQIHPAASP